ncbi:MAG: TonB-dependent receptor [Breznakibacter sp.]
MRTILISLIFFLYSLALFGQRGQFAGKVTDARTGEELVGAAIVVEGSTTGTITDFMGEFVLPNLAPGTYTFRCQFISYEPQVLPNIVIKGSETTRLEIKMKTVELDLKEVQVVAKANRSSENMLLIEQKNAVIATQAIGNQELSRKGVGDAETAVTKVSGISKQEGVKNVFVRGLGDRYNATTLNNFPIPSEDPEYKNIALEFFGTDIIQNIGVGKVFSGSNAGDVGGAVINITSKELIGEQAFGADVSAGFNTKVSGVDFLHQDGSGYWGFANSDKPSSGKFDFPNSLDPSVVKLPVNHSYALSGGKQLRLGANDNPFSFFLVASHSTGYSFTNETVRNTTTNGTIYQDQVGEKYSQNTNQLVLGNVDFDMNRNHNISYNFMMLHANNQYVGEYSGKHTEKHQDSDTYMGFLRRQQTNDNLLFTHQLISDWELSERLKLKAGASYNNIKGLEPDRRENYLSEQNDGSYNLTGSNRQKRFFSELKEDDYNIKTSLDYKLNDRFSNTNSTIVLGYDARFVDDKFNAVEYNFDAYPGVYPIENLKLDDLYNETNFVNGQFRMTEGDPNSYHVTKYINSGYADGTYQLASKLTGNLGFRLDYVDMAVNHRVQHVSPGKESIRKVYSLPSLNLKYDVNGKNSLRLGVSKTYTLPQSKEISPYQYVNIGFASQGNPNLKPSDNYNIDLKWDNYLSPSELISVTAFYKHIVNPIGRVDQGNSAGLLSYNNISDFASVAGVELEARKNVVNHIGEASRSTKLSIGLNASYIYTNIEVDIENTPKRNTQLEGAAPFITNFDISYNSTNSDRNLAVSLVFNYFSDRIHTIGAQTYKDIVEEGVPTLDFVSSYKFNKHFTLKLKATNLLDPSYRLTRESSNAQNITLNEYRKGMSVGLGLSFEL